MGIRESHWQAFIGHLKVTLDKFRVPPEERAQVLAFIGSTKATSSNELIRAALTVPDANGESSWA